MDAKKVTDSCSEDRKKKETVVVYVAGTPDHIEGKLLGTAVIKSRAECGVRMGRSEAAEVNRLCDSWGVTKNIIAQVFDTTATNTGCENGACTIYEAEFLKRKVLWCACRRHVDEVIVSDVWKALFGKTSSPDNELFQEFRDEIWSELDTTQEFKTLDLQSRQLRSKRDEALAFYNELLTSANSKDQLPRADYKESAQCSMQLLGAVPPGGVRWYMPASTSNVRWMVTHLYTSKMVAFSKQFLMEDELFHMLHRLAIFLTLYYIPHWLTTSIGVDAPVNDLLFFKNLLKLKSIDLQIAMAALSALIRHMWYLTEEFVPICLFSSKVCDQEKAQIAKQIVKYRAKYCADQCLGQPIFPTVRETTQLKDLIGPKSWLMFSFFDDASWLKLPVKCWNTDANFKEMLHFATHLKVVNDLAERGVQFMANYSDIITKDVDQKQYLLQSVEDHRRRFTDCKKKTLLTSS